jgi:hypothetical protein
VPVDDSTVSLDVDVSETTLSETPVAETPVAAPPTTGVVSEVALVSDVGVVGSEDVEVVGDVLEEEDVVGCDEVVPVSDALLDELLVWVWPDLVVDVAPPSGVPLADEDDERGVFDEELEVDVRESCAPEFSPGEVSPATEDRPEPEEPGLLVTAPAVEPAPATVPAAPDVSEEELSGQGAAGTPGVPAPPLVPAAPPPAAPTAGTDEDDESAGSTTLDAGCCPPPDCSSMSPSAPSLGTTAAIGFGNCDDGLAMNQIAPISIGTASAAPRMSRPRAAWRRRSSSRTSRRWPMPSAGVRPEDTRRDDVR